MYLERYIFHTTLFSLLLQFWNGHRHRATLQDVRRRGSGFRLQLSRFFLRHGDNQQLYGVTTLSNMLNDRLMICAFNAMTIPVQEKEKKKKRKKVRKKKPLELFSCDQAYQYCTHTSRILSPIFSPAFSAGPPSSTALMYCMGA